MLLGLVGKKQVGKDTIADELCRNYGFERMSFAAPLKSICSEVFALSEEQLNGSLKEVSDFRHNNWTPRQIMQWVGNESGRNGDFSWAGKYEEPLREAFLKRRLTPRHTMWVDHLISNLHEGRIVVTDVRYNNEASTLKQNGAYLIRIIRSNGGNADTHPSEMESGNILVDSTIINNVTKDLFVSNFLLTLATFRQRD